jgi:hypothetical protein
MKVLNGEMRCRAVCLRMLVALAALSAHAPLATAQTLQFESMPTGHIVLHARGASLGDVLRSIASVGGFEVVMDEHLSYLASWLLYLSYERCCPDCAPEVGPAPARRASPVRARRVGPCLPLSPPSASR